MNKNFVLDCSATMSLFLPDEELNHISSKVAELLKSSICYAPSIWPYEVYNVILTCINRQRLNGEQASSITRLVKKLPIKIDNSFTLTANNILNIAKTNNLSIYDSAYIELALRIKCPIATLDKKVIQVAKNVGIELI